VEQELASRAALGTVVLFVLGAIAGCRATVSEGDANRGIVHPDQEATIISEARAVSISDEINRLTREQNELEAKRTDCLKEADYYLIKSAKVWTDPSVSERERPALSGQFTTLANESEAKADRYERMAEACASSISVLQAERDDQLRWASDYRSMTVAAPNAK